MDGILKDSGSIPDELPLTGGFYASDSFRFIVYGKTNSRETTPAAPVTIGGKTSKVSATGSQAFKNSRKITSIVIGKNITTIGISAFRNCKKPGNITVKADNLKKAGKNALKGIRSTAKIKVPAKKRAAYEKLFRNKGRGRRIKIVK